VVVLQPNQTKVCPAFEADLMIENCVKQVINTRQAEKIKKGLAKPDSIADWTEPNMQRALIEQIFLGKQDLINQYNQNLEKPKEVEPSEAPRRGRPPVAAPTA
jgi:hypothetical protein